jgi:hypothetical protein
MMGESVMHEPLWSTHLDFENNWTVRCDSNSIQGTCPGISGSTQSTAAHTPSAPDLFRKVRLEMPRRTGLSDPTNFNSTVIDGVSPSNPITGAPITFLTRPTDQNFHSSTSIAGVYIQDQVTILPQLQAILGVRYDRFEVDFRRRDGTATPLSTRNDLISPRFGLVFKRSNLCRSTEAIALRMCCGQGSCNQLSSSLDVALTVSSAGVSTPGSLVSCP